MERGEIYLDNSATTRPYDEVLSFMDHINRNFYGNPSSLHLKGIEAERQLKNARTKIAQTILTDSRNIYFTSGGTEANNIAILGYLKANRRRGRHIISTHVEHPSVLEVLKSLENDGYRVDYIDVDNEGYVNMEMLKEKVSDETVLASIIYVNNETGTVQPVRDITGIIKRVNPETAVHVDAVQAYGKMDINVEELKIDLLTVSAHKIHGPKGVGAIYAAENTRMLPVYHGGGQESGIRSGTENVAGICGFGKAAGLCTGKLLETTKRVEEMKKYLEKSIISSIRDCAVISPKNSSPYILNISFPGIKAEVLLHHLEKKGIYVSTGSACHSRRDTRSHVLKAMGLDNRVIEGAIRISFSSFNTMKQMVIAAHGIEESVNKLSGLN